MLNYGIMNRGLSRLATCVLVLVDMDNGRHTLRSLEHLGYIHCAADVSSAVADKNPGSSHGFPLSNRFLH